MNLSSFFASSALVVSLGLLTGCSGYRVVHRTPDTGVVALLGDREGAREKADGYIRGQCPLGYDVLEEGEVVVGNQTQTQQTSRTRVISHQNDVREWRLTYRCHGTSAVREVIVRSM